MCITKEVDEGKVQYWMAGKTRQAWEVPGRGKLCELASSKDEVVFEMNTFHEFARDDAPGADQYLIECFRCTS